MTIEEMKERKKEMGYSYEQVAERSGLPVGTVQKVLGGITKAPRYDTLRALEKAFIPEEAMETDSGRQNGGTGLRNRKSARSSYSYTPSVKELGVQEPAAVYSYERKQGDYTLEDYYKIPEERRVELIDGVIYDMAAPNYIHQMISGEIFNHIANYVRQNKGKCIPGYAPLDVRLDCDDRTMVQPDVLVVCDRDKLRGGVVYGAPDFVAEIFSKSTRKKDMYLKLQKYADAGVREYWMIDPERQKVIVHDLEREAFPAIYGFKDVVPVLIFDGECQIDFGEIYEYIEPFMDTLNVPLE